MAAGERVTSAVGKSSRHGHIRAADNPGLEITPGLNTIGRDGQSGYELLTAGASENDVAGADGSEFEKCILAQPAVSCGAGLETVNREGLSAVVRDETDGILGIGRRPDDGDRHVALIADGCAAPDQRILERRAGCERGRRRDRLAFLERLVEGLRARQS